MTLRCRSCTSPGLQPVLDLGWQPASDDFPAVAVPGPDRRWPLEVWLCSTCSLAQLRPGVDVPPGEPLAVVSATARARAAQAAAAVRALAPAARTVRVIDSHHGGSWRDDLLSVGFMSVDDQADVVVDNHELSHQPDLRQALADRVASVRPGGRLVIEFFHFQSLVEQRQVDNVRHGHPLLLTVGALAAALGRQGFEVVDAQPVPVYGGSMLVVAASAADGLLPHPRVVQALAAERDAGVCDVERLRRLGGWMAAGAQALHNHLLQRRDRGVRVAGYGAPSKACILLGVAGIGPELLPYTVDLSPDKIGRRIPGCGVPILPLSKISEDRPDEVLILCWDLASEVVRDGPAVRDWGGTFWVPLPELLPYVG